MNVPEIIHIVGNRPQFIKLAVLYDAIRRLTPFNQYIIHTGQHSSHQMSEIFFEELEIPNPDVFFRTESHNAEDFIGTAAGNIASVLKEKSKASPVLVYGDTNSTLAAALAAKRNGNPLFHFESGVRTADSSMPEEINRVLTDRLSDAHYCCTALNLKNLQNEGYGQAIPAEVVLTGDLMLDAFLKIPLSEKSPLASQEYAACTIHRAGNIMDRNNLSEIVMALNAIHRETEVVIPLHPHTGKRLREFDIRLNCTVIAPLGYPEMKRLIRDASFVITDSGGTCREAFFSKKKSLIIMEYPFWQEITEAGAALHCGPDADSIVHLYKELQTLNPGFDTDIFGEGKAAEKIAAQLKVFLS